MKPLVIRCFAVLVWGAALYPLGRWWWRRLSEPMDAGFLAAIGVLVFAAAFWRSSRMRLAAVPAWKLWLAAGGVLSFGLARLFLPLTLAALPGVLAGLPLVLPEDAPHGGRSLPLFALAALSLPSVLILDLFLGVPLRSLAVSGAEVALKAIGFEVVRRGFELTVDGHAIWVDAPCAGVKMLVSGAWLACVLAQVFRLNVRRTLTLGLLTLFLLVMCNAFRVTVLTLCEASGRSLSETAHSAVGLAALVPGVVVCAVAAAGLGRRQPSAVCPATAGGSCRLPLVALVMSGALCCLGMLFRPSPALVDTDFPGWPRTFESRALEPMALEGLEFAFAKEFPGRIGRFRAGDAVVILRWTDRATHRAHSASACLCAAGWRLTPLPMVRRDDGDWSSFRAERDGVVLTVREQVRAADGGTLPDIPNWFASALLGRTKGPWWIVTVVE